ncbi:heparinase II/III family protein [Blautia liquoris]|uniref:Heparinase II/III family protein n=1 Tax=Blautia liquoris TaxID=2779518 RepID=A0A7M2RK20_9FIRM|nr:heparinase II/III family protein [Blautia liquoris]QOV20344.1 heparinase II/III family protein [Blautia liquoris]
MFKEIASKVTVERLRDITPYHRAKDRFEWEELPEDLRKQLIKDGEDYIDFIFVVLPAVRYMDFSRDGNRSRFEAVYFERRRALNALVLAECVEHEGRFMEQIINGVIAICEESGWQLPAHNNYPPQDDLLGLPNTKRPLLDLFACETGEQLAAVIYLLDDELNQESPLIRKRVSEEIETRIIQPYLNDYFRWMGGKGVPVNNWTPWCTQNVLLASMLPGMSTSLQKEMILKKAASSLDDFLDSYGEDGCCNEGVGYFRASGLCLFQAIEILNMATDDSFESIYQVSKIKNIAEYSMNMHIADSFYANFSDCSPTPGRSGVREFLYGKRTGNQELMQFAADDHRKETEITMKASENLYYRLQAAFTEQEIRDFDLKRPARTKDIYYDSVGILIARDEKLFLAVKAGCNDDSHNHNDTGSITVYKNGKPVLIDVGVETYSRKTFSEKRYEIWTMQSIYHNVVNFGGTGQLPGRDRKAVVDHVMLNDKTAEISMELSSCYLKGDIDRYTRTVTFDKGNQIKVVDQCSPKESEAVLTLMTLKKPEVLSNGDSGKKQLAVNDSVISIKDVKSLDTETIDLVDPKLQAEWGDRIYRTVIRLKDGRCTFYVE